MSYAAIHPNWEKPRDNMVDGYSLEMTAKELDGLREAAPLIRPDTQIAVTFLPGEEMEQRVEAAVLVRELGFEPIVHLSARRLDIARASSTSISRDITSRGRGEARVHHRRRPARARRPVSRIRCRSSRAACSKSTASRSSASAAIPKAIPNVSKAELWVWMERKIAAVRAHGMIPLVVTQFAFDDDAIVEWIGEMRARGIDVPVRLGVPGPAGIKRLLGFAKRCGVGASASVMKKYGVSITNLIGSAGPDKLVNSLDKKPDRAARPRAAALLSVRRADRVGRMDQRLRRQALS